MRRIFALGLSVAGLLASARADATPGAVWWVDASGACEARRDAFQREISLACEAVGGTCHVVETRARAELVAHLECESADTPWTLETRTVEGTLLGRVDLAGAGDDRLREAAVEVARDAAPERGLAAEALRDSLARADGDVRPKAKPSPAIVTVALGPSGSFGDSTVPTAGGGATVAGHLVGRLRATFSFDAEMGGTGYDARRMMAGSFGLAYGAPFDRSSIVGASVDFGVRGSQSYVIETPGAVGAATQKDATAKAVAHGGGFIAPGFYVQWPDGWVRPYVGWSFAFPIAVTAHLGVAVDVF